MYRSGKRSWDGAAIEESLDLLADHDYENLKHKQPKHVPTRSAPTWASLAQGASNAIAADMVRVRSDGELREAIGRGKELLSRLQSRSARVPNELRHKIELIGGAADALTDLLALRDGAKAPTFPMSERLLSLRMRLGRLGLTQNTWLRGCVEKAAAAVLSSQASPGLKAMLTRLAAQWLPPPPQPTGGVQVQWSDSEDDF